MRPPIEPKDLREWDVIVVNTSGGKDSMATLLMVAEMAREACVLERVVAVHADLGRVEWPGVRELAQEQAEALGVRFEAISRAKGDLLAQVEARGRWPDSSNRYCTSDQKRDQVAKVLTWLAAERAEFPGKVEGRPVRVLNCMGFRAEESAARAKRKVMTRDERTSSGRKEVWTWLPIHDWTLARVWEAIKASGLRWHRAYDLGMPRLSCVFCIFAPKEALVISGHENRALLDEYVALEARIGHRFTNRMAIAEVKAAVEAGERPSVVPGWEM